MLCLLIFLWFGLRRLREGFLGGEVWFGGEVRRGLVCLFGLFGLFVRFGLDGWLAGWLILDGWIGRWIE